MDFCMREITRVGVAGGGLLGRKTGRGFYEYQEHR
jgi:3-hydroxyacyl-CoA dehydrogenase